MPTQSQKSRNLRIIRKPYHTNDWSRCDILDQFREKWLGLKIFIVFLKSQMNEKVFLMIQAWKRRNHFKIFIIGDEGNRK